jgi:alkylhydroperoxidase family enzyme
LTGSNAATTLSAIDVSKEAAVAWIRELSPQEDPAIKEMHDAWHEKRGFVPNIIRVFSLKPELMRAFDDFSRAVTFGGTSLGRRREELISFYVSSLVNCRY